MGWIQFFTTLGIGSAIGILIKHLLDRSSAREAGGFEFRKEAPGRAAAVVSGFGDRTINLILSNGRNGKVHPVVLIRYQAEITKELSSAFLFVSPEIAAKLRKLNDFAQELYHSVIKLMSSEQVPDNIEDPHAREFSELSAKINAFETELLEDMKRELNIQNSSGR